MSDRNDGAIAVFWVGRSPLTANSLFGGTLEGMDKTGCVDGLNV